MNPNQQPIRLLTSWNDDIVMAKVTPCFENGNIAIAYDLLNGYGFGSLRNICV